MAMSSPVFAKAVLEAVMIKSFGMHHTIKEKDEKALKKR